MKLIINLPTDKEGWCEFNNEFAKLQSELVLLGIRKLNISYDDRERVLLGVIDKIKERLAD